MRTSLLLAGPAVGMPSMRSQQSLEYKDPLSCQRVSASTSQVKNLRECVYVGITANRRAWKLNKITRAL